MYDDDEKTYETPIFLYVNLKVHLYLCFLVNETTNPQLFDCCRSIPATHGGYNDSRLGEASSGIVLSPILRRYRSTTSRWSGFLKSQSRRETAFWWCHNGPVTSQSIELIQRPINPLQIIEIYRHIDTWDKVFMTPRCRTSTLVQLRLIYFILTWLESLLVGRLYLEPQRTSFGRKKGTRNSSPLPHLDEEDGITPTRCLLWCFHVKIYFLSMNEIKNPQRLDCGRGNKTMLDSAESRLESF